MEQSVKARDVKGSVISARPQSYRAKLARVAVWAIAAMLIGFAPARVPARAYSMSDAQKEAKSDPDKAQADVKQPAIAEARELKQGQPVEREMAGGEAHRYSLALKAGECLTLAIEQKGIDVVVRVFDAEGRKLAEVDFNPPPGSEYVLAIAESSGSFQIEVQSTDKAVPPGRYEIVVKESRIATPKDRVQATAQNVFEEALRLTKQQTADSLRRALEKFEESLPLWREAGERRGEAHALQEKGITYAKLSEHKKALEYLEQALRLWREIGDRLREAEALTNIGTVYWRVGDQQKALGYYNEALPLRRAAKDTRGEAATLINIGAAYWSQGRPQEALSYYNEALPLSRAAGNRLQQAVTLNNIAPIYQQLGELQKALDHLTQALSLRRELRDLRGEATTLHNLGGVYLQLGELQKALEHYNQSLSIKRTAGDRLNEAITLESLSTVYARLGDLPQALDYAQKALTLSRAIGDRRMEAYELKGIGRIYNRMGEPKKALEQLNQALNLTREIGDRQAQVYNLNNIGESYIKLGDPQGALAHLQESLKLSRDIGSRFDEATALYTIARAQSMLGQLAEASAQSQAALEIIESARAKVVSQEMRSSFLASYQDVYKFYIDLLMRMHREQPSAGHDQAALYVSERARARSLLELLVEAGAEIKQGVDIALLERERTLQRQLSAKSERLTRLLSGRHTEEQAAAARKEVETLLAEHQNVEAQIRAKSPRYAALTQPQPLTLKEIQQQVLDKDTLLLEYSLGEERSYLWAVTDTSISSFELPKRAEIEAAARSFYELITKNKNRELRSQQDAATALSRMLLGPVAGKLGQKRLLIVSDGALQYLPFAALSEPVADGKTTSRYQPLIARREIISMPSASALAVLRREVSGRKPATKKVAVLADPVFQSDDPRLKQVAVKTVKASGEQATQSSGNDHKPDVERSAWEAGIDKLQRLPYSRKEAEAIAAYAGSKDSLKATDFDASREVAMSDKLGEYQIAHFATHGLLNNVHPELSGIVLSLVDEKGQPQNGFVRLHEIYNLKLPAELVVLSACQTALGKEVRGEGLVGLTRGFMYAGAARVVVSLWAVSDEATAEFMKKFYEAMFKRDLRPAAALREAQAAMAKSEWWGAPYYWAGFILQGEWR